MFRLDLPCPFLTREGWIPVAGLPLGWQRDHHPPGHRQNTAQPAILYLDPLPVARYDMDHEVRSACVRGVRRTVAATDGRWPTHDVLLIGVQAEGLPRSWWSGIGHDWS
jgi:hypothetical protein